MDESTTAMAAKYGHSGILRHAHGNGVRLDVSAEISCLAAGGGIWKFCQWLST
jgi:hypothetical protein